MKAKAVLALVCALSAMGAAITLGAEPAKKPPAAGPGKPVALAVADMRISGPYTHENLAIFLLHGTDRIKGTEFLTLKEALEAKKLIIQETGNVNALTVQNVGKVPIYIQSGEIIKGGKQDRMLQYDFVVPAKSGKQPISSFCVEQGRWSQRGNEDVSLFSSSNNNAVGNSMKLAAKLHGNQGQVWKKVAGMQGKLSASVGQSVNNTRSKTSMQLTLENKKLKAAAAAYQKTLSKAPAKHKDVIGIAVAINGDVSSMDVYACGALFTKLWPKLLETSAFEAVAGRKKDAKAKAPTAGDVRKFALEVEKARARQQKIHAKLMMTIRESDSAAVFETTDANKGEIHRSYLKKDD